MIWKNWAWESFRLKEKRRNWKEKRISEKERARIKDQRIGI
jgi:hypothetical protein